MMGKKSGLLKLAKLRQADDLKDYQGLGYSTIGNPIYGNGSHECDLVSPYTKSAHNEDAKIFVLMQDWTSHDYLVQTWDDPHVLKFGYDANLPTNKNLDWLLYKRFELERKDTYATNLFPFIKPGGMSTRLPQADLVLCAKRYAISQIEIVGAELVVCIGLRTFNAVRRAKGKQLAPNLDKGIAIDDFEIGSSLVRCQAHTGHYGSNARGGLNGLLQDWNRMSFPNA